MFASHILSRAEMLKQTIEIAIEVHATAPENAFGGAMGKDTISIDLQLLLAYVTETRDLAFLVQNPSVNENPAIRDADQQRLAQALPCFLRNEERANDLIERERTLLEVFCKRW